MIHENAYIHQSAFVDEGAAVGKETKIWHFCHVMAKARIGEGCTLGQNVFIADNVEVANDVKIQNNVSLYDGVICEDNVFIGPSAVFTNVINPRSGINRRDEFSKTILKKGSTIGANATIICGNKVNRYAFIGAGAVITKDVPDYALMVGNPARQIGWMSRKGHRLNFDDEGRARCPETGEQYKLENGNVRLMG